MKRIILIFHIIITLISGSFATYATDKSSDTNLVITSEKRDDGKKFITAVFNLNADSDLVYNTLREVKKFPEFMPGSADVELIENDKNIQIVKFSGSRGFLSGDILMKRIFNEKNKIIEWSLVEGPLREVCGSWRVEKDNKKETITVVYYSTYVDAGLLIPGFLVRKYLNEDIQRMVPNIKKRVESGGLWMSDEYIEKIRISSIQDKP